MVQFRKLVMAVAVASTLAPGMASALELGPVIVMSARHQPLHAEIELRDLQGLTEGELIPKLASSAVFSQAGVDRRPILYTLKFAPVIAPGRSVIRITSTQPINAASLSFMMEVLWPNGRIIREMNVSLGDTAKGSEAVTALHLPAAKQEAVSMGSRPRTVIAPPASTAKAEPKPAKKPAAPDVDTAAGEYQVKPNDRLWDIAMRSRSGGSVQQAMLALQELNPDAFVDNNINRLKVGHVLRLPNSEQVQSRSHTEAVMQVDEQMAAWRGESFARPVAQLDATRRTTAGRAPAQVEERDSLRLVAAGGEAAGGSEAGRTGGSSLEDGLAVAQESLDSSRRVNAELRERVAELESQLNKLRRLIELKDSRLAALQSDLSPDGQPLPEGAQVTDEEIALSTAMSEIGAGEAISTVSADASQADAETGTSEPADASSTPMDGVADTNAASADGDTEAADTPSTADAQPSEPEAAVPPVAGEDQPAARQPGLMERILAHPLLWWVIGGLALLVMFFALYLSRRESEYDEYDEYDDDEEVDAEPVAVPVAPVEAPVAVADAPASADDGELDIDLSEADLELDDLEMDELELPEVDDAALELARASIESGDIESAREVLQQVLAEGNESQRQEAQALLNKLV